MTKSDLPTGTVTLLFTDIEGSTKLLHELGPQAYAEALHEHRRLLREAFTRHGGAEVDTEGDAFFVAFADAGAAVAAVREAQAALAAGPIRVRMGLHTGSPHLADGGYVGADVHLGARIAASAHGGQVVLSQTTRELLGEAVDLLDLGEHRVKDFAEPVWIYQLGTERFPLLKTISNTNLPRPASSFLGRDHEVAELGSLLRDGARLVTLSGPGGTGKTRLAIEAAAELVPDFRNGVFWVPLAALRDPKLVADTIAMTIGAKDSLAEHIGAREMLLLVDNLEQLVAAAPELASLVEACPNLRVLVTSRERLRVRGETEYAVPPLATHDAVTLFCERAGLPADQTIADLCVRLDDLPLAVELAAARTNVLTPAQILDRLAKRLDLLKGGRDADPRQATLRATIEWSHELLSAEEQILFARLSVFRGGFTLAAAEAVAEADLDVLSSLVDKSLLRKSEERFTMLETIREFAAERLEASGEADSLRRRHAEYFLALADEAHPNLLGSPGVWLDRLEAEHDNFRAAMDRLEGSGDIQEAMRLVGLLYRFWYLRGYFTEAARRIERLLAADPRATAERGSALLAAAVMATNLGDPSTVRARATEALEIHRSLGDEWSAAYATMMLSNAAFLEGAWDEAVHLSEQCLSAFRALGDDNYVIVNLNGLAAAYGEMGDRVREKAGHEEALAYARATGNQRQTARSLYSLSWHAVDEGRPDESLAMIREALLTYVPLGEVAEISMGLRRVAWALAAKGDAESATRFMARAEALREETATSRESWVVDMDEKTLGLIAERLDQAAFDEAWVRGRSWPLEDAIAVALGNIPPVHAEETA